MKTPGPRPRATARLLRVGLASLGGWISTLLAAAEAPSGRFVADLPYVEGGVPLQSLDIRTPDGAGPFPVVILVHGGGWSSGDKRGAEKPKSGADITPWFEPLTAAGFVWVSINYRLAPADRWPAALDDTRAAVAWVRAHIAEHGGDPARLAIMGHSAGGHLALLAGLPQGGDPAPVQAVVGCAAVSDLVSDSERRGGPSVSLQALFDLSPALTPEIIARLRTVSPVSLLATTYPPTLLLHGEADKTVPLAQSQAFQARLAELGVPCDLHVLPAAGHRLTEWETHDPTWTRTLTDWLHQRLAPRPSPAVDGTRPVEPVNDAPPAPLIPSASS